jgi:hypothetical protein
MGLLQTLLNNLDKSVDKTLRPEMEGLVGPQGRMNTDAGTMQSLMPAPAGMVRMGFARPAGKAGPIYDRIIQQGREILKRKGTKNLAVEGSEEWFKQMGSEGIGLLDEMTMIQKLR